MKYPFTISDRAFTVLLYTGIIVLIMWCSFSAHEAHSQSIDSTAIPTGLQPYAAVDGYYSFGTQKPTNGNRLNNYTTHRYNEIAVSLGLIGARYAGTKLRGAIGFHAGTFSEANYTGEPEAYRHIYEAYAGTRFAPRLWLDAGVFLSHIGAEGPLSKDRLTASNSMTAELSPYYESGARLTYTTRNDHWLFSALVLNGWQTIRRTGDNLTGGTQVQYRNIQGLMINSSTFFGNVGDGVRLFHNAYITYNHSNWQLAATYDQGRQRRSDNRYAHWRGVSTIARRRIGKKGYAVGRFEYYRDDQTVVAVLPINAPFRVSGVSLGLDYAPDPQLILRSEFKGYRASSDIFNDGQLDGILTLLVGFSY